MWPRRFPNRATPTLSNRLDVDTRDYDLTLLKVWEVVSVEEEDNAYWSSFDSFDDFMCSWLV